MFFDKPELFLKPVSPGRRWYEKERIHMIGGRRTLLARDGGVKDRRMGRDRALGTPGDSYHRISPDGAAGWWERRAMVVLHHVRGLVRYNGDELR